MNILMFMWRDIKKPTAGGAGRTTHELCKRWAEEGHKVTVFTSAFPECKNHETIEGYEVVRRGSLLTHYYHAGKYYKKYCKGKYDLVIDHDSIATVDKTANQVTWGMSLDISSGPLIKAPMSQKTATISP